MDKQYPNNIVQVFNRWGNLIYESEKGEYNQNPWDGAYKGELLPTGSFFYIINPNDDVTDAFTGSVSIILN